jgi:hypothetical protein
MFERRSFFAAQLFLSLGALMVGACQGDPLGAGGEFPGLETPTTGTATQDNRGLPEKEVPFRLTATAALTGQDLAPDFGPPGFGKSEFEGRCSQQADFVIHFALDGSATRLGHVTASAEHCTILNFQAGTGTELDGVTVFTAANGDELWASYEGSFAPGQGFVEDYQFTGGTGQFSGASGDATATGVCNLQTGTCTFELSGAIAYDASQGD